MATTDCEEQNLGATAMTDEQKIKFTKAFCQRLPRELRDEVYSYLWDDETTRHYINRPNLWYCEASDLEIPQFLSLWTVSHQFAFEALEWIFSHCSSIDIGHPENLDVFLEWDAYGLGLKPKDCPLRRFTFTIPSVLPIKLQEIDFQPLLSRKFHPNFAIHITITALQLWKVIKALQPEVRDIRRFGYKVTAEHLMTFPQWNPTVRDMEIITRRTDVTHVLQMKSHEWKYFLEQKCNQTVGREQVLWERQLETHARRYSLQGW